METRVYYESYFVINTSIGRTFIYTCGHIIIAMNVVYWLTGASLLESGIVALLEPCINGFWYYLLDKLWTTQGDS